MQTRSLRKSARLVVVVTPDAHHSQYVRGEVSEFRSLHREREDRLIIQIGTAEALSREQNPDSELLNVLPSYPGDLCLIEDFQINGTSPSNSVVEKLANDFDLIQNGVRRGRVFRGLTFFFALLAISIALLAWIAEQRRQEVTKELSKASFAEATRITDLKKETEALPYLARALRIWAENEAARCRLTTLLSGGSFPVPISIEPVSSGYTTPTEDSDQGISEGSHYRSRVKEGKIILETMDGSGRKTEFSHGLPNPYGTVYNAAFDSNSRYLLTTSQSRTGTFARIWSTHVESTGSPISGMFVANLRTSDVAFIQNEMSEDWKGRTKFKMKIDRPEEEANSTEEIVWEVSMEQAETIPVPVNLIYKNPNEATDDEVALVRLGWKLLPSGDESPYKLANSAGNEFPLDHGGYANTYSIDISESGHLVATAGEDRMAKVWTVRRGLLAPGVILEHPRSVWSVHFSKSETMLLTATGSGGDTSDSEIRIWEVASGKLIGGPWAIKGDFDDADISLDGSYVWCRYYPEIPMTGPDGAGTSTTVGWPLSAAKYVTSGTLADLAEAVSGWRILDTGSAVMVPIFERIETLRSIKQIMAQFPSSEFTNPFDRVLPVK